MPLGNFRLHLFPESLFSSWTNYKEKYQNINNYQICVYIGAGTGGLLGTGDHIKWGYKVIVMYKNYSFFINMQPVLNQGSTLWFPVPLSGLLLLPWYPKH